MHRGHGEGMMDEKIDLNLERELTDRDRMRGLNTMEDDT